jgi:hypothetical protein
VKAVCLKGRYTQILAADLTPLFDLRRARLVDGDLGRVLAESGHDDGHNDTKHGSLH